MITQAAPTWEVQTTLFQSLHEWWGGSARERRFRARRKPALQLKPDHADAHYSLGIFLARRGRSADAAAAYRKAIALKPDYAESHCNLGIVLWHEGELAQALIGLKRGHELGSQRKDSHYPSAEWVRECRRQLEVKGRPR
jgi:Tfp pilus assembly protein PilF